jgi:hypothetical protein
MSDNNLSIEAKVTYWSNLVAEQTASGKIMSEFCRERQVCSHRFRYWRDKLTSTDKPVGIKKQSSRFIAVAHKDIKHGSPRITLPNGVFVDLGVGLDSTFANQFLLNLCRVGSSGDSHAKS